jgi:hypothetical protein
MSLSARYFGARCCIRRGRTSVSAFWSACSAYIRFSFAFSASSSVSVL